MPKPLSAFCYSNIKMFSYLKSFFLSPLNMPSSPLGGPSPCELPMGITRWYLWCCSGPKVRRSVPPELSAPCWPACPKVPLMRPPPVPAASAEPALVVIYCILNTFLGASGLKAEEAALRLWSSYWQIRWPHWPCASALPVGALPPEHFLPDLLSWISTQDPEVHSSSSLSRLTV